MSFQKYKLDSYFVGRRRRSATTNIVVDTISKEGYKVLFGHCSLCISKKSMAVFDSTVVAAGLGDFYKNIIGKRLTASEKMA